VGEKKQKGECKTLENTDSQLVRPTSESQLLQVVSIESPVKYLDEPVIAEILQESAEVKVHAWKNNQ
jgi:hypothetical protein